MNAARKALQWSWSTAGRGVGSGYAGNDGTHKYEVLPVEKRWRVLVDGAPLRSRSHNVIRSFETANSACWHAELESERRDVARSVAS